MNDNASTALDSNDSNDSNDSFINKEDPITSITLERVDANMNEDNAAPPPEANSLIVPIWMEKKVANVPSNWKSTNELTAVEDNKLFQRRVVVRLDLLDGVTRLENKQSLCLYLGISNQNTKNPANQMHCGSRANKGARVSNIKPFSRAYKFLDLASNKTQNIVIITEGATDNYFGDCPGIRNKQMCKSHWLLLYFLYKHNN